MRETLKAITLQDGLSLSLIVTGMHLDDRYGMTVEEIKKDDFPISARIPVDLGEASGASMANGIARMIVGFTDSLQENRPDILLLLGDRGEMLAGAIAAIHLNIPVAHIHGGERSGTVDEPIRHAISKLAHIHLVATEESRHRLVRMGERPDDILVVGAPGLSGLATLASSAIDRDMLAGKAGFDPARPIALMVHHPVLQEAGRAGEEVNLLLDQLVARNIQTIALMPNADGGSDEIRSILTRRAVAPNFHLYTHLPRAQFINWMVVADFMIGNSSSGIIEAATFGTPVINVGRRQRLRERNANVIDVEASAEAIDRAIDNALAKGRFDSKNVYGDGNAAARISTLLTRISLTEELMMKSNDY